MLYLHLPDSADTDQSLISYRLALTTATFTATIGHHSPAQATIGQPEMGCSDWRADFLSACSGLSAVFLVPSVFVCCTVLYNCVCMGLRSAYVVSCSEIPTLKYSKVSRLHSICPCITVIPTAFGPVKVH